ncbi:MAG: membrane-bound lytic murein transglycosylase B [Candidatus Endobugula sp.]|jgi:membrane-bound lytic murein transglycosylase B
MKVSVIAVASMKVTLKMMLAVGFVVFSVNAIASSSAVNGTQDYVGRADVDTFIDEMVNDHQFSREDMRAWFSQAVKKQNILEAIARPAEKTHTWASYQDIFLTSSRLSKGVDFWIENEETLARAEEEFGVPASVIVAIIGVETRYGGNKGSFRVIDALSTLGFDYPPRASFFRKELKEFFLLAREQKQDPMTLIGSYAGAMGYGQFIPSSYRAYAIDYTNDEFADIWNNATDAIGSVANYFKRHGWEKGQPVIVRTRISDSYDESILNDSLKPKHTVNSLAEKGYTPIAPLAQQTANAIRLEGKKGTEFWIGLNNYYVITRYNHSRLYAMSVWQLSQQIAEAKQQRSP